MAGQSTSCQVGRAMIKVSSSITKLVFSNVQFNGGVTNQHKHFFKTLTGLRNHRKMNEECANRQMKQLAPPLDRDKHKGQAGRIGIFGGSAEYTGAPYFAAISSLRVGADLVYVFCPENASPVIKSYSPELIVLPLLNQKGIDEIKEWIDRLHVVLLGPGLGREQTTFSLFEQVINMCKEKKKPLVIDADGLFFVAQKHSILENYPAPIILTPNAMEFKRLVKADVVHDKVTQSSDLIKKFGGHVTLLCKDMNDEIISNGQKIEVTGGGSGRRCGGQGDLMSGACATFLKWSLDKDIGNDVQDFRPSVACFAASKLTRECNSRAFAKHGRSMICTDMLQEIHGVFEDEFEVKS